MSFKNIKGADSLNRKFAALPKAYRETIDKTLEKAGAEMARTARALVPTKTGTLRDSIGHSTETASDGIGRAVKVFAGDDDAFYARIIESKQPYFNPAFRLMRRLVKKRIKAASRRATRKIVGVA